METIITSFHKGSWSVVQREIIISFGNISSVDEMEVILSVSRKDPLVASEILVGKIEIIIISFYKVSLVVKKDSATILITILPTHNFLVNNILWSVKRKYVLSVYSKISWSVIM